MGRMESRAVGAAVVGGGRGAVSASALAQRVGPLRAMPELAHGERRRRRRDQRHRQRRARRTAAGRDGLGVRRHDGDDRHRRAAAASRSTSFPSATTRCARTCRLRRLAARARAGRLGGGIDRIGCELRRLDATVVATTGRDRDAAGPADHRRRLRSSAR